MKCQYCKNSCVKNGKQKDGTQKYRCKNCKKYQQEEYRYQAKILVKRELVVRFVVRNAGFRGIAGGLKISVNTVMKIIHKEAGKCLPPVVRANGVFEVDEIQAYCKKGKPNIYGVYAINGKPKR